VSQRPHIKILAVERLGSSRLHRLARAAEDRNSIQRRWRCQTRSPWLFAFAWTNPRKQEFIAKLQDVFAHIVKEETFVEASLVPDMRNPKSILNYEVWNESPESFMKNQMSKAYRAEFEKMIVDLKIDRTPAWYSTIAQWKRACIHGANDGLTP
jgi:quinol monooxygenase YgiN